MANNAIIDFVFPNSKSSCVLCFRSSPPPSSPFHPQLSCSNTITSTYSANLWQVASTITTLGYGDINPRTIGGRAIASIVAWAGTIVVAIASTALMFWVPMMPYEEEMASFLTAAERRNHIYDLAANVIQTAWRCYAVRKSISFVKVCARDNGAFSSVCLKAPR
jgi:hypothetical protein